jgi:hypothetical protein
MSVFSRPETLPRLVVLRFKSTPIIPAVMPNNGQRTHFKLEAHAVNTGFTNKSNVPRSAIGNQAKTSPATSFF